MDGTPSGIQVEQKDSEIYCQKSCTPLVILCTAAFCVVCCYVVFEHYKYVYMYLAHYYYREWHLKHSVHP